MENVLQFQVKFITPLLIHGADGRSVDTVGLTGKALRGCWRFWCRAIIGGMRSNITPDKLYKLESQIFGSADENIGLKFRMLVEPVGDISSRKTTVPIQFSQRMVDFKGFQDGVQFNVKVIPNNRNIGEKELDVLLSSIWLWGNLGAIGQRSRRGFGSPVILEESGNIFTKHGLSIKSIFTSKGQLEGYFKEGLEQVWSKFSDCFKMYGGSIIQNPPPSRTDHYFTLGSLRQIAVCNRNKGANVNQVLQEVHGRNSCLDLGHTQGGKLASPVFVRLHKVDNGLYPVVTWSKPNRDPGSCARKWLVDLGFTKYLSDESI